MSKKNLGLRSLILTSLLTGLLSWIQIPSAHAAEGLNIYFKNEAGSTTSITRTDFTTGTCNTQVTNLNFAWGSGSPTGCNADGFTGFANGSIIWPGTAGASTGVTFYSSSDDGSFVVIDGATVIDSWIEQGDSLYNTTSSVITKTAGIAYPFKAYFHENGGGAVWRLFWSYSGQSTIIAIPVASLSTQTALTFTLSTSSSTYTTGSAYTQALTLTPSGGSGTGATTYAITSGGTATSCALSSSGATPTITATTSGTCKITATKAADVNYSSTSSSAMTFTFNKAAISVAGVAGVTAPVRGATPVTTTTAGTGYTGTVTWSGSPSVFAASTAYTATITLTATSNYTLTGVSANFFTVTGTSTAATHLINSGVITAVFPATAALSAQAALSFTLSTASSTYTGSAYTQALTLTPSGGTGTGATTYAITSGGTATTCALSSSGATPTITATTSGTCLITATKAADVNYSAISSSAMTFTFNTAAISALSLSLAGGVITAQKGRAIVITVAIDQAGKVSFFVDGKRIPRCFKLSASASTKTCSWKPTVQRAVTLSAELTPTNSAYSNASGSMKVQVTRRTSTR